MKTRPSARLVVIGPDDRVLLFRFRHARGPLAGRTYWATPGGALEAGETFEDAAARELLEETGIAVADVGSKVAERTFPLQLSDGEWVTAEEQFFLVRVSDDAVLRDGWTAEEREVMTEHRWWTPGELAGTTDIVYPDNLAAIIAGATTGSAKRKSA